MNTEDIMRSEVRQSWKEQTLQYVSPLTWVPRDRQQVGWSAPGAGEAEGPVWAGLCNEGTDAVWEDEKVLETTGGDGHTATDCTPKRG